MGAKPELSIGFAVHNDFNGAYFTVQALRLYQGDCMRQVELLVIDNDPGSDEGRLLADMLGWVKADTAIEQQDLLNRVAGAGGLPLDLSTAQAFLKDIDHGLAPDLEHNARAFATACGLPADDHDSFVEWCRRSLAGVRYIPAPEVTGTAAPRDRVFREAKAPAVVCLDAHVLLWPGAVESLLDYYRQHPDTADLLSGPMLYDDLRNLSTHFDDVWREEMWGVWGNDPRGQRFDAEPFEVPAMGLGLFSMRKDAWPGFNPRFRGFGGEEFYIHAKVRRQGGKCLCLPFLRWLHRFGRPGGPRYPLTLWDKVRNYVIGHQELGLDLSRVHEHFVAPGPDGRPGRMSEAEWREVIAGADWPAGQQRPNPGDDLECAFVRARDTPADINEHVPALRNMAATCARVTALGGRHAVSTVGLLAAQPERLTIYDTGQPGELTWLEKMRGKTAFAFRVVPDTRVPKIEETDLLFIDSKHTAEHLWGELIRHAPQVQRWIVLHDTVIFGETGEDGGPGLLPAVRRYLETHPEWVVKSHALNNHGLMVLARLPANQEAVA